MKQDNNENRKRKKNKEKYGRKVDATSKKRPIFVGGPWQCQQRKQK